MQKEEIINTNNKFEKLLREETERKERIASFKAKIGKYPILKICKKSGEKVHVERVYKDSDIPKFLKEIVKIIDGKLIVTSLEGEETAELGSFVAYEKSDSTECGYNAWIKGNALETLVKRGNDYVNKPKFVQAQLMGEDFPKLLEEAADRITKNADGSYTIITPWGKSTGYPGKAFWVLYGKNEDGSLDANILNISEESFRQYLVYDENDNEICYLYELFAA